MSVFVQNLQLLGVTAIEDKLQEVTSPWLSVYVNWLCHIFDCI